MTVDDLPDLKGTIFIVTYGRSGSTLLQSLLQSIPGAHITGENNHVLEALFRASRRARETRQKWGDKAGAKDHPWYNAAKIRPARFEQELVDAFVRHVLAPPPGARWVGFKEIRFAKLDDAFEAYLDFHRRCFHNAFFVFNSRNGEDVANSKWHAHRPRNEVLELVQKMDERFADYALKHPECSHRVFYEQTVENPASLQSLFDKLGEPFDPDVVDAVLSRRLTH